MECFRNWMKNNRAVRFLNKNMKVDMSSIVEIKKYLSLQASKLGALTFIKEGFEGSH